MSIIGQMITMPAETANQTNKEIGQDPARRKKR